MVVYHDMTSAMYVLAMPPVAGLEGAIFEYADAFCT